MLLPLDEVKKYLRVDYDDEDEIIAGFINTAEELVTDVARMSVGELPINENGSIRAAMLDTVAYLFEHREEADHHQLVLNLRYMLFGIREPAF